MKKEVSVYLDFLRLTASFAVFLGHSYAFTGETWGRGISTFRNEAVAVFFVISGFVIAYVTSNREKTREQYAIARLGRLYSVAIPAILLTLLCDKIGLSASSQWYVGRWWFNPDTTIADLARAVTFTNEYWNSHVIIGSNEPYWSIGFEASYYVIYAAIAFPIRNRFANTALIIALLMIFGPKIISYLPLWMIGVLAFHLIHKDNPSLSKIPSSTWLLVLIATAILFVALKAMAHYLPSLQGNIFEPFELSISYFVPVPYYTLLGVLAGLSIVAVANAATLFTSAVRIMEKPVRWLAGGTFTLYLLHQPILLLLVSYFPGNPDTIRRAVAIQIATLIAVYCIAEITERRKSLWTNAISILFHTSRRLFHGVIARTGASR